MYKLFLCLRYLRKRRIAFFAVAAVCLCVAMVLIVVSVMDGFLQMVKDRSRGMLGDLIVHNRMLQGFPYYQEFIDTIKQEMPERIDEATPVVISYGVLRYPQDQRTFMCTLVGIRLEETCRVNEFGKGLFYERYYPGTTSLGRMKGPCVGLDAAGQWVLPPDLEAAWQKWRASAGSRELAKAPINEKLLYKRPGLYRPMSPREYAALGAYGPAWLEPELNAAILGTDLCATRLENGEFDRQCARGEEITLTFVPLSDTGKLSDLSDAFSKSYRYVDDVRTGVYEVDSTSVYIDFDELQRNLKMDPQPLAAEFGGQALPARATQVQIKLKPGAEPKATRDLLLARWDGFVYERMKQWRELTEQRITEYERNREKSPASRTAEDEFFGSTLSPHERIARIVARVHIPLSEVKMETWEEKQQHFIAAVEKEKVLVTTLFGVISVVAVFLVGCIFYMIVQQKTRDIGIIKSVGATRAGVANIFIAYGLAVGIVGGALGMTLGTVFVWHINEIQDFLKWINPALEVWSPTVYTFDRIPNRVNPADALTIYFVAVFASMLGSLIAAYRAARVWPVEALRYE